MNNSGQLLGVKWIGDYCHTIHSRLLWTQGVLQWSTAGGLWQLSPIQIPSVCWGELDIIGDYCDINYSTKLTIEQIREICGGPLQGIECFLEFPMPYLYPHTLVPVVGTDLTIPEIIQCFRVIYCTLDLDHPPWLPNLETWCSSSHAQCCGLCSEFMSQLAPLEFYRLAPQSPGLLWITQGLNRGIIVVILAKGK